MLSRETAGNIEEPPTAARQPPSDGIIAGLKLSDIGPGLLLAATGIGVGDMVSSTIAGAEYGLTLVWALVVGVIIKFAITEGAARWQLATGTTLIEGWRDALPRVVVAAFFLYFIVWSYFVSSALVTASALVPTAIMPVGAAAGLGRGARGGRAGDGVGRPLRALPRRSSSGSSASSSAPSSASALLIVLWSGADWSRHRRARAVLASPTRCRSSAASAAP